jgi:hypothetical protein
MAYTPPTIPAGAVATGVPLPIALAYMTKQFGPQSLYTPASPSVFGTLKWPSSSGTQAETDCNNAALATNTRLASNVTALGGSSTLPLTPNPNTLVGQIKQVDAMRSFYDSASIQRDTSGNPVV